MRVLLFAIGVGATVWLVATDASWYWIAINVALDVLGLVSAVQSLE